MRFASAAAESRIYWPDTMESIERALRAVGGLSFVERATLANGVASSELPRFNGLTTMCTEQSAESLEWAYTCLRYGELVERQAKTLIGIAIAGSVQRLALEAMGESESAVAVEERIEASRQESVGSYDEKVMLLIMTNQNLFYAWVAAIKSVGEVAAKGHIAADIERLIRQRPELACD